MRKSLIKAGVLLLIICLSLSSCEFALLGIGWLLSQELEEEEPVAGFSTQPISDEQKAQIVENLNITLLTEEPSHRIIQCFDVREDGRIAIGTTGFFKHAIYVYDSGEFLYGYSFKGAGDFGIEWNGDCINIYSVRSDLLKTVSPQGEVEEILEIPYTYDNDRYSDYLLYSTERNIGGNKYVVKKNVGIFNFLAGYSYSQLFVTDDVGSTSILYDATNAHLLHVISLFSFVILVAIGASIGVIKACRDYF